MLTKKPGASVLPTGEHSLCGRTSGRPEPGQLGGDPPLILTAYNHRLIRCKITRVRGELGAVLAYYL